MDRTTFIPQSACCIAVVSALALGAPLAAQQAKFDFTIKNMMRGPELYGREPAQVRWSPDGRWIYFQWLPPGTDWREPMRPHRIRPQAGAQPERVTQAHLDSVGPLLAAGSTSRDRARRVVEFRGDLFVVDLGSSAVRRLTETIATESAPRFSSDGQRVLFVRDGNAYSVDLASGATRQLTDIRGADQPAVPTPAGGRGGGGGGAIGGRGGGRGGETQGAPQRAGGTGALTQRSALEADQRRLFEAIRDQQRADSISRAEATARDPVGPKTVQLLPNERVAQVVVSPSGGSVLFTTTTAAADVRATIVPNYVTSSGFTEDIPGRTKVGDAQNTGRLGFQVLPRGDVKWIRPIDGDDTPPAGTNVVAWSANGGAALVAASAANWKTRQLSIVDGATGTLKTVEVLRDSAWVGGPCGGCAGFYDDDRRIYWVSEATGWAQLHSAAADGSDRRDLTSGTFEIYDVALSADAQSFFFHSSEVSPFDRHFYRMPIAGGARTMLTAGAGAHQAVLAPDESRFADVHSVANRPGELHLSGPCAPRGCEGTLTKLTTSPTADWLSFNWIKPEIVMVPASDGVRVPARIYRPGDLGARANGAAVIFVHGAGYLHNVHNYWSSYSREYMFNHYLASRGYVVLDIDYRASAGYGRDWRTAIYRWMGGRDLADQVDGSKYLTKNFGIDPERIGMYGGSYGGFMTLMALFTAPRYFGAGAALRSVTDWAHYNHGYTSQILNTPQADSIAYRRSSPIFLAEGLEDPLVMLHGMVDTNVHFEDIVRLTQRLIELGKTGWDLAVYPVENHGFTRPASWTDEYTRIFDLFERTIGPKGSKARR